MVLLLDAFYLSLFLLDDQVEPFLFVLFLPFQQELIDLCNSFVEISHLVDHSMLELSLILEVIALFLCRLLGHCFFSVVVAVLGLALLLVIVFLFLFLTLNFFAFLGLFHFDSLEIA